jgi:hypothetical protein
MALVVPWEYDLLASTGLKMHYYVDSFHVGHRAVLVAAVLPPAIILVE